MLVDVPEDLTPAELDRLSEELFDAVPADDRRWTPDPATLASPMAPAITGRGVPWTDPPAFTLGADGRLRPGTGR